MNGVFKSFPEKFAICPKSWCQFLVPTMVFCFQKLFWLTVRKKCSILIEKPFSTTRLKVENFQHLWDDLNNLVEPSYNLLFEQWKVRTNLLKQEQLVKSFCLSIVPSHWRKIGRRYIAFPKLFVLRLFVGINFAAFCLGVAYPNPSLASFLINRNLKLC